MHNNERKAIYYALRHAQVPVDFLSEDDVTDGRAKDYSVIYVTQQYLHSKYVDSLQKWCEAGGTVVALCGGGFLNEFQKENPATATFFGATGTKIVTDPNLVPKHLLRENVPFLSKHDLPRYEPMDAVNWNLAGLPKDEKGRANPSPSHVFNVPVIVWKQPLTVTDGTVVGTFKDGSPAVVKKAHGKGRRRGPPGGDDGRARRNDLHRHPREGRPAREARGAVGELVRLPAHVADGNGPRRGEGVEGAERRARRAEIHPGEGRHPDRAAARRRGHVADRPVTARVVRLRLRY
jgi:hypothetical protein